MTATNTSTKSNASDTVNPEVLDADALTSVDMPSDDAGNTEAPAEAPKDDNTKAPAEAPKDEATADKGSTKISAKQQALENASYELNQAREANDGYTNLGPLYVSAAPVANSLGAELGFSTTDEKTNTVQRTGIGFYIRSDHLCNKSYDANVKVAVA